MIKLKVFQPLEQFEIYNINLKLLNLFNTVMPYFSIYINNYIIYIILVLMVITVFFKYSINNKFVIPKI